MDNTIRLQYLEAMGIDVWLPRTSVPTKQTLFSEVVIDDAELEPKSSVIDDWNNLQIEVTNCKKCTFRTTASKTVFGSGNKPADWMLVGEAPGQQEDEQGIPFAGSSGALLTEMLRAIGLSRKDVFITNILKCRPPDNRTPHINEISSCINYIHRQQQLIQPKIIVALGLIAAQSLLKTNEPLANLRGKVHMFNDTPVIVTHHPAYLLRFLSKKREAWLDLTHAIQKFKNNKG